MAEIRTRIRQNKDDTKAKTFTGGIKRFINKVKGLEDLFIRELCQDLFQSMVTKTPVLYGFARASWYVGINDANLKHAVEQSEKVDWANKIAEAIIKINDAGIGDIIYLLNNCVYIRKLEYGHSKKAPEGMVRVTLSNYKTIADDVVKRITAS